MYCSRGYLLESRKEEEAMREGLGLRVQIIVGLLGAFLCGCAADEVWHRTHPVHVTIITVRLDSGDISVTTTCHGPCFLEALKTQRGRTGNE